VPDHNPVSPAFYHRLSAFYRSQQDHDDTKSKIWMDEERIEMAALSAALAKENPYDLAVVLHTLYRDHPIWGIDHPKPTVEFWMEACLWSAVCLGVLPMHDPEQCDESNPRTSLSVETIVSDIEREIAGTLTHPGGGAVWGAEVGQRFIPFKLFEALNVFVAARRLGFDQPQSCLEIGGGAGFTSYLFHHLRPACVIHLIDLPKMSVVQAFLLAVAFGEHAVVLEGEPVEPQDKVFIHGLAKPIGVDFDIVCNRNSMPEMTGSQRNAYLAYIESSLTVGGVFISDNREGSRGGQGRVYEAALKCPRLQLMFRAPSWGRDGQVQEVWRKITPETANE
jgi:hypothetical protein